jgi:ribosomal protein S15P/S13E
MLLEIYAKHMGKLQQCVPCVALGLDLSTEQMLDLRHHLKIHASDDITTRHMLHSVSARANSK